MIVVSFPYPPPTPLSGHFFPTTGAVAHSDGAAAIALGADERSHIARLTFSAEHEHCNSIGVRVRDRTRNKRRAHLAVFVYERQNGAPDSTVEASMRGRPLASRITRRSTSDCSYPTAVSSILRTARTIIRESDPDGLAFALKRPAFHS